MTNVYKLPTVLEIQQMRMEQARQYLPSAQPYINEAHTTADPALAAFNWREAYQHAMNALIAAKQDSATDQAAAFTGTVPPKAIVQEGKQFRIYEAERHLGDPDYLLDIVEAPVRCRTDSERREWFAQTLLARSLGTYEYV